MSFSRNRVWAALALLLLVPHRARRRRTARPSASRSQTVAGSTCVRVPGLSAPKGTAVSEKELRVDAYSLWLKRPGQVEDVVIWKNEVMSDVTEGPARFLVSDVMLKGDSAYVLSQVRSVYGVDNVKRDTDGVLFKSSTTNLARHLEFQPIFKAEFLSKSKPQIVIEYKASGGENKIRRWFWFLNGECWNRK